MNKTKGKNEKETRAMTLVETMSLGEVFAKSGMFSDAKTQAQAVVKILAGRELGLSPIVSMTKIYMVKGKITVASELMGAQIKRSGEYDYEIDVLTETECVLVFYRVDNQKRVKIGESKFTLADAEKAGVAHGDNWKRYPRNMLLARALSNGARWHCPHLIAGAYITEEMTSVVEAEVEQEKANPETVTAIQEELEKYDKEILERVAPKLTAELTQIEADQILLTLKTGKGIEKHRLKEKVPEPELNKQQILALKFYGSQKLGFKGSHVLTELEKKEGRKKVLSTKDPELLGNAIDSVKLLVKGRKEIETTIQNKMDWRKTDKIDATILKALATLPMEIRVDMIRRIDFLAGKDEIVKLVAELKG